MSSVQDKINENKTRKYFVHKIFKYSVCIFHEFQTLLRLNTNDKPIEKIIYIN